MSPKYVRSESGDVPKSKKTKDRDPVFRWQYILPIVLSLLALSISLWQVHVANKGVSVNAYTAGSDPEIELDKAYLANHDLRPYFYENKHLDSNNPARTRVLALAEMSLDCFQVVLVQGTDNHDSLTKEEQEEDLNWIAESFKNSEVLRDFLDSHQSWYSKQLRDLRHKIP